MADNKVFDAKKNMEMHKKNLELISKNTEISASTLKVLTTFIDLVSNLSVTNLPNTVKKIAGLANPIADAIVKIGESKIEQIRTSFEIPQIEKTVPLEDLDKTNPIKTGLNQPDFNSDFATDYGQTNISVSKKLKGGLS